MPDMTNQQYAEYVKRKSPASPLWGDLLRAFLIGGAICALGQVITELWVISGLSRARRRHGLLHDAGVPRRALHRPRRI